MIRSIFLILINIFIVQGWRPYQLEIHNITYVVSNPKIFDFHINQMTKDNRQYFGGQFEAKKQLYRPFVHIDVVFDSGNETYDLLYLNRTFNYCEFLLNRKLNIFLDIAYRSLARYIELPKRCPIPKKLYKVDNFTTGEFLPPVLPEKRMKFFIAGWNLENGNARKW